MENFRQTPFALVLASWTQLLFVAGLAVIFAGKFGIGLLMSAFSMARSNTSKLLIFYQRKAADG